MCQFRKNLIIGMVCILVIFVLERVHLRLVLVGWLFLDSSTSMFVNARSRVHRFPESKKKLKADAEKQRPCAASGELVTEES